MKRSPRPEAAFASSLRGVRDASTATLAAHVLSALDEMAAQGTTTVEAKSGYGLSFDAEMKSLEAIREAAKQWPGTVVPTLLGAHVVHRSIAIIQTSMCAWCARR